MNIDYTIVALMFPAIPLIMNVYSSRFHTLSALIRKIHDEYVFEKHTPPEWKDQLKNLNDRISVLKYSIMFGAFGFLFNMITVFALYLDELLEEKRENETELTHIKAQCNDIEEKIKAIKADLAKLSLLVSRDI